MARSWYVYNNTGDPQLPYSFILSTQKPNCLNGFVVCAIYATDGNPVLTSLSINIQNYVAAGLVTGIAQPQGSSIKKYVYMKPDS